MNRKRITVIFLMFLVLFGTISFAFASDASDNDDADSNTLKMNDEFDKLSAAPGSFSNLDEKIQSSPSGTTVVLDKNYTYSDGDDKNGISIDKDLTIDGAGYTLNGANQASIFKISGNSHVIFKNINFINAYGVNGSAIALSAGDNVEVSDSKFINNRALGYGGAIYISSLSTITANSKITNSLFINNRAVDGGAIAAKGTLFDLVNSSFANNYASGNGGSLFFDVGVYLDDCVFTNSHADKDGGALYYNSIVGDINALPQEYLKKYGIYNSKFISCSADNDGGSGYINGSHGIVSNVTIINCTAGNSGGGGYIDGDRGKLINSTFINNSATRSGGAMVWSGINGMIYGCEYINNTARDGAAIFQKSADDVSVYDGICIVNCSSFVNNVATFNGGAIYCSGIFVVIHNSRFVRDGARDGAGIYLDVGASIEYCNFIAEKAKNNGGAIYLSATLSEEYDLNETMKKLLLDNIGVRHSTIINCSAGYDGGAGYVAGDYGIVANVTMINNNAGHDGGAGYISGSFGKLVDSTMIGNRAARDGGAVMWAGNNGTIYNVTCMANRADGGSGSVCAEGSNLNITSCRFMLSNSTLSGGAIYVYGDNVNITDSIFDRCAANSNHGGAISISGRNAYISGCEFLMNRVNVGIGRGGAINIQGEDTEIEKCSFDRCTAAEGGFVYVAGPNAKIHDISGNRSFAVNGGAFYIKGDNTTIYNAECFHNNATTFAGAIYVAGDFANIYNINLARNIANNRDGGAIYIKGLNTTISNANFTQNMVTGETARGGAICVEGNFTRILNSTFNMCTAYDGGVIYIEGSYAFIDGYSCIKSLALNDGGAIYVAGDYVEIADFDISLTNSTNYGGAIFVAGNFANIHDSNLTMCTAYNYNGGAIYVLGLNTTVSDSNFVMNKVNPDSGCAGSIGIRGNYTKILNCTFERCNAYDGGVIYINGSHTVIDGYSCIMSFASNDGGAIYVAGDYAFIADFNISLTNATNYGGAIYVAGDFTTINNSNFTRCIADIHNGGAFYILGLNTTVSNSNFVENRVNTDDGCGGSIAIHGNFTKILNCTFDRCTAYEGGVIYINGSHTEIGDFDCIRSFASNKGGSIYIEGDYAKIAEFNISLTNATNYGGAIYVEGDFAGIHDSVFARCIVDNHDGGALYVEGLNSTISNSSFIQNRVNPINGRGGSVVIQGNNTNVLNCSFSMCTAYEGGLIYINGSDINIDGLNSLMTSALNRGGNIFIEGHDVTVNHFNISRANATHDGGAIYISGDRVDILNGYFYEVIAVNGDGGAVYVGGYNSTVKGCTLDKAQAFNGYGGAIYLEGDLASVEDSNFVRSFANDGGIIYISGNDALIINDNFTFSWSVNRGGAIYIEGHDVVVDSSYFGFTNASLPTFEDSGWGGAIYIEGDNVNITSSEFFKNIAEKGGSGGAIFIRGENVNIEYSNFTYCAAPDYFNKGGGASAAGAIAIGGHDATVNACNFQYSNARNGGVMFVEGSNTKIIDSNISRSFADSDGGAIYIFGENTNISGTSFEFVKSEKNGGAVYIRFGEYTNIEHSNFTKCNSTHGGAIDVDGSDVIINSSNMFDCFSSQDGGAIYITGNNVSMINSNFTGCFVDNNNGGVIYWIGSTGIVDRCNFINNTAPKLGGAIFMKENSKITFENSNFINNTAGINGGAIDFNRGAHDEIILNSTFVNNIANRSAGAVFWFGTNGTIKNSVFTNNKALGIVNYTDSYGNITYGGYGGAVMWTGAQGVVDNCTFINNEAQYNEATKSGGRGGAVYLQGSDVGNGHDTAFYNSVFINNTAGYNGGAVDWFRGAANGRVENSTFINNTAKRSGGGIYWSGVNGTIINSTFFNNSALGEITDANGGGDGGAVLWVGPEGFIQTVNFTNNKAAFSGGAIYLKGSDNGTLGHCNDVYINDGIFENNSAGLNGGAIDFQEGAINGILSNSYFKNNTALRNGGALFWYGHNGTVMACNFTDNAALGLVDTDSRGVHIYVDEFGNNISGGNGGAISWIGDIGSVEESNFINNTAKKWGGAVFLRDNSFTSFKNSNFINNAAGGNGGAINFNHGAHDGSITNSTFINNTADRSGGAVFWCGVNGIINDSEFINNSASGKIIDTYGGGDGGAVIWVGHDGKIDNSVFRGNNASYSGGAIFLKGSEDGTSEHCYNVTVSNGLFENNFAGLNGGAVNYQEGAINGKISDSVFNNNTALRNGGAVFWYGHNGTVMGCNFTDNVALGVVDEDARGVHKYVDSKGRKVLGGSGGAIAWSGDIGSIMECNFQNNIANRLGGAVFLRDNVDTTFINSRFTDNIANQGGALYWRSDSNETLTNCIFLKNKAEIGSAIYFEQNALEIISSILLDNRADSAELNIVVTRSDDNHTIEIQADFKGYDNLINAIWNNGTITFTNVTYWGVNGVTTTGNNRRTPVKLADGVKPTDVNELYQTQYEAGQNITFAIYDSQKLLTQQYFLTNISGEAKFSYENNEINDKLYEYVFHPDDNYYTGIDNSTSKHMASIEIPAADIYYLENESFEILVIHDVHPQRPTGNVTLWINGQLNGTFTLKDGKTPIINFTGLNCGVYDISVRYNGDDKFFPSENKTSFKVMKIPSFISPTVENYTFGKSGKIIIEIPKNENNTVDIVIDNKTYQLKINESGYAEFVIPEIDFGVHKLDVYYPETNNYLKSSNSTLFEIYPIINVNVVKSANVTGNVYVNEHVNYTIVVSNDGQITATNVNVTDILPDGFKIISSNAGDVDGKGVIIWNIGDLKAGSKVNLWVVISPLVNGTFTNVASVSSSQSGENKSNEVSITVDPIVDLSVTKEVSSTEVYVGDDIRYTVTVLNNGPSNATDVKVTEILSKYVTLTSAQTQYGYYDENEGIWYIGNLANNEAATLTLTVKAISNNTVENAVSVTSAQKEFNESDNRYVSKNVSVLKRNAPIEIEVSDIRYGEYGHVEITLPENVNGYVNVTVNDVAYNNLEIKDGKASLTLYDLAGGDYKVDVVYGGDGEYSPNSTAATFNVAPVSPTINIEVADILEGEIEVLNVTVNAPGSVNITVNGITVEIPLDEGVMTTDVLGVSLPIDYQGKATWKLVNLAKGKYAVSATYNGNENYTAVSASDSFNVRGEIENVDVNVDNVVIGQKTRIEVKYPGDVTGKVTLTVGGKSYTKSLKNGAAVFEIPDLKAGSHEAYISYEGSDKYMPHDSNVFFEIFKVSPNIKVDAPGIKVGENGKVTVTLPKDATGMVSLEIGGKYYDSAIRDGKAVFIIPNLKFGDYNIAVHYLGDDKYDEDYAFATISIDLADDKIGDANHRHSQYGEPQGLAKYPTSNPVWLLLIVIVQLMFPLRRFKK